MTTLKELLAEHSLIQHDPACSCGERFSSHASAWMQHAEHTFQVQRDWLKDNAYGQPLGTLEFGTTCLVCGAVVGLPDLHRQGCFQIGTAGKGATQ